MKERGRKLLGPTAWVGLGGGLIGLVAVCLEVLGNPPNMGICVVCFERDISGALGLHRALPVQYLRPEIPGFVLGGLLAALLFREFRPRSGSSPLVRFFLGAFATIGALVFLGCTWRLLIRLSGLDYNAVVGLAGLLVGVGGAVWFERRGFHLGRSRPAPALVGWILPGAMATLLLLAVFRPAFGKTGILFESANGPGAMHAALLVSLAGGLAIGLLAQRSRFCTVGSVRSLVVLGESRLLVGAIAFVVAALVAKLALGMTRTGFLGQPVAHSDHLWNFLGMVLAGLGFMLAGGCPGRQLVVAGEGSADAGAFVLGSFAGAAFAHNLALAAVPDKAGVVGGPGPWGQAAVIVGIVFCVAVGLLMRERS